jgi:glucan biosynthesis protein C
MTVGAAMPVSFFAALQRQGSNGVGVPLSTQSVKQRIHYVDNGRALASVLGIFYHSACVFSRPWVVNADAAMWSQTIWALSLVSSYCRMPLFLFVAGYFTMYGLHKYTVSKYLAHRSHRILLPFVVSVVTLVPIQEYFRLRQMYGDHWRVHLSSYLNPLSTDFTFEHIWFLYHILVFSLLMAVFFWANRRNLIPSIAGRFLHGVHRWLPATIVFWAVLQTVLQFGGNTLAAALGGNGAWLDLEEMGNTLPMFLFGCYCFSHRDQMDSIFRRDWRRYAALIGVFALLFPLRVYVHDDGIPISWGVMVALEALLRWLLTLGVLGFLRMGLDRSNRTLRYLSEASYPVYLFHQPFIVALSFYLVHSSYPYSAWTGFALVSLGSLMFTYLAYEVVVRRNRLGAFLYTGVPFRRRKPDLVPEPQTATSATEVA